MGRSRRLTLAHRTGAVCPDALHEREDGTVVAFYGGEPLIKFSSFADALRVLRLAPEQLEEEPADPRASVRSILIIEDDREQRETLCEMLGDEGWTVAAAADGHEALSYFAAGGRAGAIVLDLRLPGMDGWTFRARQLGDPRLATIPTVVVTASEDVARIERLAADFVLQKPFDVQKLIEAVERLTA